MERINGFWATTAFSFRLQVVDGAINAVNKLREIPAGFRARAPWRKRSIKIISNRNP